MRIYFIVEYLKLAGKTFYEIEDVAIGIPNQQGNEEYVMIITGEDANMNLPKFRIGIEAGAMEANSTKLVEETRSFDLEDWRDFYITEFSGRIIIVDEENQRVGLTCLNEKEKMIKNISEKEQLFLDIFFPGLYENDDQKNTRKKNKKNLE